MKVTEAAEGQRFGGSSKCTKPEYSDRVGGKCTFVGFAEECLGCKFTAEFEE